MKSKINCNLKKINNQLNQIKIKTDKKCKKNLINVEILTLYVKI